MVCDCTLSETKETFHGRVTLIVECVQSVKNKHVFQISTFNVSTRIYWYNSEQIKILTAIEL